MINSLNLFSLSAQKATITLDCWVISLRRLLKEPVLVTSLLFWLVHLLLRSLW